MLCVLILLVAGVVALSADPAFAWTRVNKIAYHFWAHNNTGVPVNDATIRASSARFIPGLPPIWQAPRLQSGWAGTGWPPVPLWAVTGNAVTGIWRRVTFGGVQYPLLPPSSLVWFNADFRTNLPPPVLSQAWFRWTQNGVPVGPWRWLGWRWGSDPSLYNPPENPDGTPNTQDMVVTDLQFASSPTRIPNDETTLDNPEVQALFAASQDPVRPGPIVVQPDSFFDVFLDVSIPEPTVDGSTVLATGNVEDEFGESRPFVVQFIAEPGPFEEPAPVPASRPLTLAMLGFIGIVLSATFLLRRTSRVTA